MFRVHLEEKAIVGKCVHVEGVTHQWVPQGTCFKQNWWHIYVNGFQAVNLFEISGTQCVLPCIAEVYDIASCMFSGQFKEVYIYVDKIKFHVHVALPKNHLLLGLHCYTPGSLTWNLNQRLGNEIPGIETKHFQVPCWTFGGSSCVVLSSGLLDLIQTLGCKQHPTNTRDVGWSQRGHRLGFQQREQEILGWRLDDIPNRGDDRNNSTGWQNDSPWNPSDSRRDSFGIPWLEVTNNLWKGHVFHSPKKVTSRIARFSSR